MKSKILKFQEKVLVGEMKEHFSFTKKLIIGCNYAYCSQIKQKGEGGVASPGVLWAEFKEKTPGINVPPLSKMSGRSQKYSSVRNTDKARSHRCRKVIEGNHTMAGSLPLEGSYGCLAMCPHLADPQNRLVSFWNIGITHPSPHMRIFSEMEAGEGVESAIHCY